MKKKKKKKTNKELGLPFNHKQMEETTTLDLLQLAKGMGLPVALVAMRDTLPNTKVLGFTLVNMDEGGGEGTHWTALYGTKKEVIYFDSFGCVPPTTVVDYVKKHWGFSNGFFSNWQIQDLKARSCGQWCLWFGFTCHYHEHYSPISDTFQRWVDGFEDDTKTNERLLRNWLKRHC